MKVKTNLISGNALNDAANLSCQTIQAAAGFVNRADQKANSLISGVSSAVQSTWTTLSGVFSPK
jgi:hypothetical protein